MNRYFYDPRATDQCRRDSNGVPIQVEHVVDASGSGESVILIHQQCYTRMRNDTNVPASYVFDTRDWMTRLEFE